MDPGCWKVKWAHRDDCVRALMVCWPMHVISAESNTSTQILKTLRRVPHLTVTWAHQSNLAPREFGLYNNSRPLSAVQASHSWRSRGPGPAFRSVSSFLPPSHTFPAYRSVEEPPVAEHPSDVDDTDPSTGCEVWQQETSAVQANRNVLPSRPSRQRALSLTYDRPQPAVSLPSRESTGQLSFTNWESTNRNRWANHLEPIEFKGSSR